VKKLAWIIAILAFLTAPGLTQNKINLQTQVQGVLPSSNGGGNSYGSGSPVGTCASAVNGTYTDYTNGNLFVCKGGGWSLVSGGGGGGLPVSVDPLGTDGFGAAVTSKIMVNVMNYGAKCDGTTDDSAAFAAAIAAIPWAPSVPYGTVTGGGTLFIPPSATPCRILSARVTVNKSQTVVSGSGATLLCDVSDHCLVAGDLANPTANYGIVIRGLALEPGAGSAGHYAIADNAQGTLIEDITNVVNWSTWPAFYGFDQFIVNLDDQSQVVRHIFTNGHYLNCDASFCGSTLYEPGPLMTNAGITYLSDFNFAPGCSGNGIDFHSGNDLHINGGVIQGYNQYAMRIEGGITRDYNINQVHAEVGACTNPLGNVGIASLIGIGANISNFGGQQGGGVPRFPQAGTPANVYYGYYIIGSNGSGTTTPISAGYLTNGAATVNSTNHITATWYNFEKGHPAYTYRVLRQIEVGLGITTPAPYGTGNWDVSGPLTEASVCTGDLCTFVDTTTSPASYTVSSAGGYSPTLDFWGGAVVLSAGASYYGDGLPLGGIFVTPDPPSPGRINILSGPTAAYYQDLEPFSPVVVSTPPGAGTLYQPYNTMVFPGFYSTLGGAIKGGINFGVSASIYSGGGPTDLETYRDSNPNKTASYVSNHPPYDAADSAACLDATGLCFRAPTSISQYINYLPDDLNWKERLYSALKIFAVPLGSFSVAQIASPSIGYIADVPTGGTLAPATQYCYRATSLDNLGESYPVSTQVCVTTANDGNSTHQVQLLWAPVNGVTRGYNVYGRTTGAEQFMALVSNVRWTGNTAYVNWYDTGALTPSGAMPTVDTTGQIQAGGKISAPTVFSTVATGTVPFSATSTTPAHMNIDGNAATVTNGAVTIATGATAMGVTLIAANSCASVVSVAATGVVSTDVIGFTPNASIKAVTGYTPAGTLTISAYPTAGFVNFDVCNKNQANSVTPGAVTLNWRVSR